MRHHLVLVVSALSFGMVLGCGGGGAASGSASGEPLASGDEETVVDQPIAEEEPAAEETEEEAPPSGPGQLRVVNRVGGQDAAGTVQVLNDSGEVVAEGTSGQTFTVPSGSYRVVGAITDASVMVDTPTHEADGPAEVLAGQEQTVNIDFPLSRVRIRVTRRGRPVARWRMEIRRQGAEPGEPLTIQASNNHIPITPGRYDATLHVGNDAITVNGIIFQGGATMDVPVNVD